MSVASKNLFDLLGNDIEDPDAVPAPPSKIVEKTTTHSTKRNADGVAPSAKVAGTNARGAVTSNDGFRDRQTGNSSNNTRAREGESGARGGRGARVRGGRGARRPPNSDDRHSRSIPSGGSDKQAALSWGAAEGEAELKDEQAGEQIAQADQKEAVTEDAAAEDGAEAEPEDKSISYADYLAQLAEKKLALDQENALKVRKANEGTKADKKWETAKELVKGEEEEVLFAGTGGKAKRERERKQKQFVELENRFIEPERTHGGDRGDRGGRGGRGGRGEFRGESSGRGRGEHSGRGRGEGGRGRGEGRGRGGPRGGARGDFRGDFRGGRGRGGPSGGAQLNPNDQSAFPSLGS